MSSRDSRTRSRGSNAAPVLPVRSSSRDPPPSSSTVPSDRAPSEGMNQAALSFLLGDGGTNSHHYPAMPKLASTSNTHFNTWKAKALLYFDSHGLRNTVKHSCKRSLSLAVQLAGKNRDFTSTLTKWMGLHEKAYALIRAATQEAVGLQLYRNLESTAAEEMADTADLIGEATAIDETSSEDELPSLQPSDANRWGWMDRFQYMNANYLWDSLCKAYERYSGHDKMRLFTQYTSLPKYKEGEDPIRLLHLFQERVYQMELAGLVMPPDIHWALWLNAIPDSLKNLQTQLGTQNEGAYMEVFEALKANYNRTLGAQTINPSGNKKGKKDQEEDSAEQLYPFHDQRGPRGPRGDNKRRQPQQPQQQKNKRQGVHCVFCDRTNHTVDTCYELKRHKAGAAQAAAAGSTTQAHTYLPFIEDDPDDNGIQTEAVCVASEHTKYAYTVFLFDSGATSHLTGTKSLLTDIKAVPEVSVTTAIRGSRAVVRERGKVKLNDRQSLTDVAYMASASTNLISEGRLCDANNTITKTKEYLLVKDIKGVTILRGVRVNRLWVYYTGDKGPSPRPINTVILNKRQADDASDVPPGGKDPKATKRSSSESSPSSSSSSSSAACNSKPAHAGEK